MPSDGLIPHPPFNHTCDPMTACELGSLVSTRPASIDAVIIASKEIGVPTLTVRALPDQVYADLKALAAAHGRSMEAEARDIIETEVGRRQRWLGATLADLSGPPELSDIAVPYVRAPDLPADVAL